MKIGQKSKKDVLLTWIVPGKSYFYIPSKTSQNPHENHG